MPDTSWWVTGRIDGRPFQSGPYTRERAIERATSVRDDERYSNVKVVERVRGSFTRSINAEFQYRQRR